MAKSVTKFRVMGRNPKQNILYASKYVSLEEALKLQAQWDMTLNHIEIIRRPKHGLLLGQSLSSLG